MDSPLDYQRTLAQNIVLAGGSTCFENFDHKLIDVLQKNSEKILDYQITDFESETKYHERKLKNWTGAQFSSTLVDFEWISKQDYFENGF